MVKKRTFYIIVAVIVIGFGVGIYLQDLKHRESTAASWKANRHNIEKFKQIEKFTRQMDSSNWHAMHDSIYRQLDAVIILHFRKEIDSLNELKKTP